MTTRKGSSRRRTKLDDAQKKVALAIIDLGGARLTAAKYLNCTLEMIQRTAQRDREFAESLRRAEVKQELTQLRNVESVSGKEWRAAVWILEHLYPDRYEPKLAGKFSLAHVLDLMSRISEVIAAEVSASEDRQRIQERLQLLSQELEQSEGIRIE